jgi:hypothetical protein
MIQVPANSIELVTASSDFLQTLRRLRCEYYSKGLVSLSLSQTGLTSTSRWNSNEPHFKCIPSDLPTDLEDYKPSMPSTDIWPSPPSIPVEGDDMYLPQELIAEVYPGKGWHYNSIKHWDYYRFLIPDPTIPGHQVVAPFINFHMHPSKPQVSVHLWPRFTYLDMRTLRYPSRLSYTLPFFKLNTPPRFHQTLYTSL